MPVYGYVRVSTDRQAEEGESLDRVFVERGVSGSKPLDERPQGAALLAALAPGDVILTSELDRMFRSALDALKVLGELRDADVSLHMLDLGGDVTGNGISKLVFTILSAVAEAERDRIRDLIRDVKADQKARRRYLGGSVPFGFRLGSEDELIEVLEQQAAIARMMAMRQAGASLRNIAEAMQADGFELSHVSIKKIVERQRQAA